MLGRTTLLVVEVVWFWRLIVAEAGKRNIIASGYVSYGECRKDSALTYAL